ncbi:TPA: HNH endonuclease [Salmonella enterica]
MTAARRDPPEDWIKDLIYYKDGALYWHECKENNKRASKKGYDHPIGSVDDKGYLRVSLTRDGVRRLFKVHRLIYWLHTGIWPNGHVDHINGDTLDNRIENLREATAAQNQHNKFNPQYSPTGYVGVVKRVGHYAAQVTIDGKNRYVNGFHDAKHAALFRDLWASMTYGDFANFNILGKKPIRINGELIHDPKHTR